MQLTDTAAIVTGGASGLGAATAAALAEAGAAVFALDLPASIEAAAEVKGVTYLRADVTDEAQVHAAVATAAGSGVPLRTAVNCAGIGSSARILGRRGVHDVALYAKVVQINLVGTFTVLALAADAIAQTAADENGQRGVIVNTASIAAFDGQIGQVAYASSKAGVVGMTLPAARDLAQHGIRVCTVAPGIVDTPMLATVSEEFRASLAAGVPFPHRLATPGEYARLVMMIIDHDYLNGETIRMDGALRMAPGERAASGRPGALAPHVTPSRAILLPPSSARRDEVLDGLIELFLAEGFATLNVSAMASRLRCSKSTLYLVAQSKEQIVLAAVRLFFKRATERVEAQVAAATDPADRLRAYLEAVSAQLRPAGPRFIADLARFIPAREIYTENTQIAARRVQQIVAEGVGAGVMRPVDAPFIGAAVAQVMTAIQDGGIGAATGLDHAEAYHQLANLVMHSLVPSPAG